MSALALTTPSKILTLEIIHDTPRQRPYNLDTLTHGYQDRLHIIVVISSPGQVIANVLQWLLELFKGAPQSRTPKLQYRQPASTYLGCSAGTAEPSQVALCSHGEPGSAA
jgi:hypothetical protein